MNHLGYALYFTQNSDIANKNVKHYKTLGRPTINSVIKQTTKVWD